jgi:hypothetical protein
MYVAYTVSTSAKKNANISQKVQQKLKTHTLLWSRLAI